VVSPVTFRQVNYPTGVAGDNSGTIAATTVGDIFVSTAKYVQNTETVSVFDIVTSELYNIAQSGGVSMFATIQRGTYPGIDDIFLAGLQTSGAWTISGAGIIAGIVDATPNISTGNRWSFQWTPQEGQPISFPAGTAFELTYISVPPQPPIWKQLSTYDVHGFINLPVSNGVVKSSTTNSSVSVSVAGDSYDAYAQLSWGANTDGNYSSAYPNSDPKASYLWVDKDGTHVQNIDYTTSTSYYYQWNFDRKGNLTLPNNSLISDADTSLNIYTLNTATIRAGTEVWWSQYGDITNNAYNNWGTSCVYDSQGNIYVVGTVQITPSGGYSGNGNAPFFESVVVKYNQHGSIQWQEAIGDFYGNPGNAPSFVTGESIRIDSSDNIYVLANEWGRSGSYVFKLNSRNGNIVSQEYFSIGNGVFSSDLSVDSTGTVYVVGVDLSTDNSILYSINPDFQSLNWQTQLGNNHIHSPFTNSAGGYWFNGLTLAGGVAIDIDSAGIYVTGQAGDDSASTSSSYTAAYDFSGNLLWQTQPFGGTGSVSSYATSVAVDNVGGVYAVGFSIPESKISNVVKYTNNGTVVWESSLINQPNVIIVDITVGSDGYLYLTGQAPAANISQLWWGKMDSNTGELVLQRFFTGEWGGTDGNITLTGHRMGAVHRDKLALNGWTFAVTTGTTSTHAQLSQANFITVQVPTDGSEYLTTSTNNWYGTYLYSDADYWNGVSSNLSTLVTMNSDVNITTGTLTISSTDYTTGTSYTYIDHLTSTIALSAYTYTISGAEWSFDKTGIQFPDGSVQTTAYLGTVSKPDNSEFTGHTDAGNNFGNQIISIKNTTGYKRLVGLTNTAQTWLDLATVATQLNINPAWISGMIMDYQVFSTSMSGATNGNMTGQIIIAVNSNNRMSVTHSETSISQGDNPGDNVMFANLDMWQVDNMALLAIRTDASSQQLDIIWTARVFINASESYC
jgi:hypothetical protein